jgi:hypothetical protein
VVRGDNGARGDCLTVVTVFGDSVNSVNGDKDDNGDKW